MARQRFISDGKRTEELTAQVVQLRRELEEANAAAGKRTEELTAQVTQLRRELEEATRAIKREFPLTSVILVTTHENPDYLFEALKAGAAGCVLKDATQEEVIIAVLQGIGGESPLNPTLVNQAAKQLGVFC